MNTFALIAMACIIGFLTGIISTVALALHMEYKAELGRITAACRPKAPASTPVGPNPFVSDILK